MALFILPAFILYGWVEFETFIWVGQSIGGLATFLGIFLTAFCWDCSTEKSDSLDYAQLAGWP